MMKLVHLVKEGVFVKKVDTICVLAMPLTNDHF